MEVEGTEDVEGMEEVDCEGTEDAEGAMGVLDAEVSEREEVSIVIKGVISMVMARGEHVCAEKGKLG